MKAFEDHRWGVCNATDRVWSHVVGLPYELVCGRQLMVWQAYVDESEKDDLFVLAGLIAPAESWARFTPKWLDLARAFGRVDKLGRHHIHMSELGSLEADKLTAMYRVIEDHVHSFVCSSIHISDFKKAMSRIVVLDPEFMLFRHLEGRIVKNHFYFLFNRLMTVFINIQDKYIIPEKTLVPPGQKVDFIFDDRAEKSHILQNWDEFVESRSSAPNEFGTTPRFEDDKEFIPLQAADFMAWWMREFIKSSPIDHSSNQYNMPNFQWARKNEFPHVLIPYSESKAVSSMINMLRHDGHRAYDRSSLISI